MKHIGVILTLGIVIVAGAVWLGMQLEQRGVFDTGHGSGADANSANSSATPQPFRVDFATVKLGSLEIQYEMLGSITRTPGARTSKTLACDVILHRVDVVPGQTLKKGSVVLRVVPAPSLLAQRDTLKQALDSAASLLEEAQKRVQANLGTKTEVLQAQQAVDSARVQYESILKILPPDDGKLTAAVDGVVTALPYSPGDLVPAGNALFMVESESAAIRFGIPARSADRIKIGKTLTVIDLIGREDTLAKEGQTSLDRIEPTLDPASLTLIGWSKPIDLEKWRVGQPVRLTAQASSPEGLVLPRRAVVLSDDGPIVHAIIDGKAVKRSVKIIAGNKDNVCIECPELSAGDRIAVVGTYELQDGAPVSEARP